MDFIEDMTEAELKVGLNRIKLDNVEEVPFLPSQSLDKYVSKKAGTDYEGNDIQHINLQIPLTSNHAPAVKKEASQLNYKSLFDQIIGHIEDILVDSDFHELQSNYLEKYWHEFTNTEENKHSYMIIFQEYTEDIEKFIEKQLVKIMPGFEMEPFIAELQRRKKELDGEVFEMLFTLTEFEAFKEMFLEYRMMKEGHFMDLSSSICITSVAGD